MLTHLVLATLIFLTNQKTITGVTSTACCGTLYPDIKIWIDVSPPVVNYTFYNIMGQMRKMWAFEVDESATVLKNRKIFEASTTSLLCPPGYKTKSRYHDELSSRSWPNCNVLCLQKNAQAVQNLKPDKWYVVCRENSCQSCNLDRMKNSTRKTEFVKVDSAVIANDTFKAHLTVLEPGMRYNVSLEADYVKPAILNATIELNQKTVVIEVPRVNETIKDRTVIMRIKPWLKGDTLPCTIAPDVQYITLYQSNLHRQQNVL